MPFPVGALLPTITDFDSETLLFPTKIPPPEIPAVFPVMTRFDSTNGVVLRLVPSSFSAPPKEFVALLPLKVEFRML
jgi:hypothetical protein